MTPEQRRRERERAVQFFNELSDAERWQLGDELLLGDLDVGAWFDGRRPSSVFLNEVDRLRMLWECADVEGGLAGGVRPGVETPSSLDVQSMFRVVVDPAVPGDRVFVGAISPDVHPLGEETDPPFWDLETATGEDLDQIGAGFGVHRLPEEGDRDLEPDIIYRQRVQMARERRRIELSRDTQMSEDQKLIAEVQAWMRRRWGDW